MYYTYNSNNAIRIDTLSLERTYNSRDQKKHGNKNIFDLALWSAKIRKISASLEVLTKNLSAYKRYSAKRPYVEYRLCIYFSFLAPISFTSRPDHILVHVHIEA